MDYARGLAAGSAARRHRLGPPQAAAADPADLMRAAQDRVLAAGGTLSAEEAAKRTRHPLDRLDEVAARAEAATPPRGMDVFLTKYHGLFYVAPAQDSFMCRLRIPGGILSAARLRGLADLADDLAAGHADLTTRANLQLRQIPPAHAAEMLNRLMELGLTARGSGADNVRNITASPTAGIDPDELIDTRADARALHFHILNRRALYGLPRKFNIAFDGGGRIAVLEETNDIAFTAIALAAPSAGGPPRLCYRMALGGITGHRDLARPTAVVVDPGQTTAVCDAVLRVFIAEGDRTDRARARLKYVLDRLGTEPFLQRVEAALGRPLERVDPARILDRPPRIDRAAHIGVHRQKQPGLHWLGVLVPRARLSAAQMRGLAEIAERFGSGTLRLTVWQNLLVSDVADIAGAGAALAGIGLSTEATRLRAGLVACTGSAGCRLARAETKARADALVAALDATLTVPDPVNIHLTGCPNSCAQHFIADIGLLGTRVDRGGEDIDGFDLHVGGGAGPDAAIGRLVAPGLDADSLAPRIAALLRAWLAERHAGEGFQAWTGRLDDAALRARLDLTETTP